MTAAATLEQRLAAATSVIAAREALADSDQAWIVGWAVRDALLSESVGDADLAVPPGAEKDAARAAPKGWWTSRRPA